MPVSVRQFRQGDLVSLERTYPEPHRTGSRHRVRWLWQSQQEGVYLVAWQGCVPIGWAFVHRPGSRHASGNAHRLGVAELVDLQVDERFRGEGAGRALLEAAEQVALHRGWQVVGLEVTVRNPHNEVARRLYRRSGYRDSGLGEFESGYVYWDDAGRCHWDREPHRYLTKRLAAES
ncbi:MAG: GNAT family N-acetyltransferase [Mycobacteriaceae bacterium]